MLSSVIIFLPLAFCLFWMYIHTVMAPRTSTFVAIMCLLAAVSLFLLSDCLYYDQNSSPKILPLACNLSQLSAPSVIPLLIIYIERFRTGADVRTKQLLWIIAPVILFTVAEMLTLLAGRPTIVSFLNKISTEGVTIMKNTQDPELRLYFYSAVIGYRIVISAEFLLLFNFFIRSARREGFKLSHIRDFFRGEKADTMELQFANLAPIVVLFFLKLFFFRYFLNNHHLFSILLSAALAMILCPFCYVALFGARKRLSIRDMQNGNRFNFSSKDKNVILEEMLTDMLEEADKGTLTRIQAKYGVELNVPMEQEEKKPSYVERLLSGATRPVDEDSLMGRFEHLMKDEKIFLQSGLTLEEVADHLNSNKTYVSKMVNSTYNISFPELVNTLRIDYAEDYIANHREARQEDIAKACGFPSASSFNNTFKRITGMPPRIWLATHERHGGIQ